METPTRLRNRWRRSSSMYVSSVWVSGILGSESRVQSPGILGSASRACIRGFGCQVPVFGLRTAGGDPDALAKQMASLLIDVSPSTSQQMALQPHNLTTEGVAAPQPHNK